MADAINAGSNEPNSHGPLFTKYLGGAWGASVALIALIALLDPTQLQRYAGCHNVLLTKVCILPVPT